MTLDDMHKLEKTLTPKQREKYVQALVRIARTLEKGQMRCVLETDFVVVHATVDQRYKAYQKVKRL